jgi:hypothetical protein
LLFSFKSSLAPFPPLAARRDNSKSKWIPDHFRWRGSGMTIAVGDSHCRLRIACGTQKKRI